MIQVTLQFANEAELLAYFGGTKAQIIDHSLAKAPGIPLPEATLKPKAPAKPVEVKAPAPTPEPKPEPKPEAPAANPVLEYKVLQAAVFELANINREEVKSILGRYGVKSAKELPEDTWNEALAAINLALVRAKAA